MFSLNDFNCMTFRHELCAATRERDDARVRLFIAVEVVYSDLWFEVLGNGDRVEYEDFPTALKRFNELLESNG